MHRKALDDRHPRLRQLRAECLDQRERQPACEAGRKPHDELADRFVAASAEVVVRSRHQLQDAVAMLQ